MIQAPDTKGGWWKIRLDGEAKLACKGPEAHRAGRGSAGVKVLAGLDGGGAGAGAAPAPRRRPAPAAPWAEERSIASAVPPDAGSPFPSTWVRVSAHISKTTIETEIVQRTRRPLYGEEFTLDIDELLLDQVVDDTSTVKLEVFDSKGDEDTCLGVCTVPILPMLDKNVRRRWMALDSPYAKPSCKGAAYGDVPGWSRLKDVLHEKDIAPLGLLDVCLRLETGAERAAYMASPFGRIRRACRKYRLKEGEDAILCDASRCRSRTVP